MSPDARRATHTASPSSASPITCSSRASDGGATVLGRLRRRNPGRLSSLAAPDQASSQLSEDLMGWGPCE
ncbi:hypothetical protein SAMD00023353_2500990 [Rosellinia necatrix]|uniref:Uncharacterized protein n=1 Tax=Rosellinia necatrix TaxID=77044 RepID=A0A1S8A811_ROSNE|nr:hypothetical protein SAMD00023353_2500990 [Rosellinia necatrix]